MIGIIRHERGSRTSFRRLFQLSHLGGHRRPVLVIGLRRAELVSLTVKHVDFERSLLYGFRRKGGSYGWASFGAATAGRLRRWIAVRHVAGTDALFVAVGGSFPGRPLTGEGLRTIVRKIGDAAGVPGVTPHAFRRSFACLLVEGGAPTRLVQELGGWADVRQVERYTQALDAQRLARQWSPMDAIAKNGKQSPGAGTGCRTLNHDV